MRSLTTSTLVIFALLVTGTGVASASVLFDNLGATQAGSSQADDLTRWAQQFKTDANSYSLASVFLYMSGDSTDSSAFPDVSIFDDASGVPGSQVGSSLTEPGGFDPLSVPLAVYQFSAAGPVYLAPSSSYWVVLSAPPGGLYNWAWTGDTGGAGPGFSTESAFDFGGWLALSSLGGDPTPQMMSVEADAIPEPASMGFAALGLFALAALRARPKAAR